MATVVWLQYNLQNSSNIGVARDGPAVGLQLSRQYVEMLSRNSAEAVGSAQIQLTGSMMSQVCSALKSFVGLAMQSMQNPSCLTADEKLGVSSGFPRGIV